MLSKAPYPGLRPFYREETDIFFGRENQTDSLLNKLSENRFIAIVGPSGCGKSSLVRAGMFASMEAGFMIEAGVRWSIADMRPGNNPFSALSEALESAIKLDNLKEIAKPYIYSTLRRGPLSLIELLKESNFPENTNFLLLIDQFEEIFRYKSENNYDEIDAFVSLLIASSKQRDLPIYVVITMRSDFIGDCSVFHGLSETMNEGQFLIPRLTREECKSAIEGPARVFGGNVESALVNDLLNDMGSDPDQLPLMQHLMMRMWNQKKLNEDKIQLTREDYLKTGGLTKALSIHADEAFNSLNEKQQHIAEVMFRSLCERRADKRDTRRPIPLQVIANISQASIDEVKEVIDVFRDPTRCFLTPSYQKALTPDTIIDISHESLIWQWERMNNWVKEEEDAAETYRLLEKNAILNKEEKAALWDTPNLEYAIQWEVSQKPNEKWAERYGTHFDLVMDFLNKSKNEHKRREEEKIRKQKQILKKSKKIALYTTLISFSLIVTIILYLDFNVLKHVEYYNVFAKKNGIPIGIGKLSKKQVQHRSVSYRLIKKGRCKNVIRIEAINSNFELTPYHYVRTYFDQNTYNYSSKKECIWEFVYDKNESVIYEKGFDKNYNFVWGFIYSPISKLIRYANYVDSTYFPSCQMNSSVYVIKFEYNNEGYEHIQRYYDLNHSPIPGPDNAYGREIKYDNRGLPVEIYSLGQGDEIKYINDKAGNALLKLKYDKMGNTIEEEAYDDQLKLTTFREGYAKVSIRYDKYCNPFEISYFGSDGKPVLNKSGYHKLIKAYDDDGYLLKEAYYDTNNKPKILKDGYTADSLKYNTQGQLLKVRYFNINRPATLNYYGYHAIEYFYNNDGNLKEIQFFDTLYHLINYVDGYAIQKQEFDLSGNLVKVSFYDANKKPSFHTNGYHGYKQEWNDKNIVKRQYFGEYLQLYKQNDGYYGWTKKYDQKGNETEICFIDLEGKPIKSLNGYAIKKIEYDNWGNVISESYFDEKGRPENLKYGYSSFRSTFDEFKNETSVTYLNQHNEPVITKYGYAGYKMDYDKYGNLIKVNYFNEKNVSFISDSLGYAGFKREYDRKWNIIKELYFDEKGKITKNKEGYAGIRFGYDNWGNQIYEEYLDVDTSRLITCKRGFNKFERKYNENGECIEKSYIKNNKLVINNSLCYAKVTFILKKGKIIQTAYFDDKNNPVKSNEGFTVMKTDYDIWGNFIQQIYYDSDQKEVNNIYGFAKFERKYDRQGNLLYEKKYDNNNKLIFNSKTGFAYIIDRFNNRNQLIEETFYGSNNEIVNSPYYKYAIFIQKYDSLGNLIQVATYDKHSKLIDNVFGYVKIIYEYNKSNKLSKVTFYGTDDKPQPIGNDSYSSVVYIYKDTIKEYHYYDANNKLVCNKDGYAILKNYYNKAGDLLEQLCFNQYNEPTLMKNGPHCFKYSYDTLGNKIEGGYYDTKYKLFMYYDEYKIHCARWVNEYSEKKIIKARYYYNSNNSLIKIIR